MLEIDHIRTILEESKTIAVVGMSTEPERPSHYVAEYLQRQGYRIIPVNPKHAGGEILGERVYRSLRDVPEAIDIVDVFRRPVDVPPVAADALQVRPKVFWMQLGIEHADSAAKLRAAGIDVVEDACLATVHRMLRSMGLRRP